MLKLILSTVRMDTISATLVLLVLSNVHVAKSEAEVEAKVETEVMAEVEFKVKVRLK